MLILDNVESIMQEERAGEIRPGYEVYARLLRWVGEKEHQSYLLLTSREKPKVLARLARTTTLAQVLDLAGLSAADGTELLHRHGLVAQPEAATALVHRYSGNPPALNLIAETVDELFDGNIEHFLQQETVIFDDIRTVLDLQFARLSKLEQNILWWLAVSREPISIDTLRNNLVGPVNGGAFLQTIRALQRRSLLEKDERGLTLQNVITEYLTERLIEQANQEIETGDLSLLYSHPLLQAQAKTYIRHSQERLILQPIAERLTSKLSLTALDQTFRHFLDHLRQDSVLTTGYAAGNILNLLLCLGVDATGYDFSQLSIKQAFLQGAILPEVNFSGANLSQTVFTDTFGVVQTLTFSPDGQLLAMGTKEGEIRLWRMRDGQWQIIIRGQVASIWSIAFSPDGQTLASGSTDHKVRLWHVQSGQLHHTLHGHTSEVWSVAFSPDGQTLASASNSDSIHLWAVHTGQLLATLEAENDGSSRAVAFSPDGRTLAGSDQAHNIQVWDVDTQDVILSLPGHTDQVYRIAFSPDGRILASAGQDATVRLWDVTDLSTRQGHARHILHGHTDYVVSLAFSPDGQTLASGGGSQMLRMWDVRTGQLRYDLTGDTSIPRSIAISPDGQLLASGGQDKFVRLWDVSTLLNTGLSAVPRTDFSNMALSKVDYHTLQGDNVEALIVTFSPYGLTLAIGNDDGSVHLWDVPRRRLRTTLKGHEGDVFAGAFSPDGRILASGGQDATVHL